MLACVRVAASARCRAKGAAPQLRVAEGLADVSAELERQGMILSIGAEPEGRRPHARLGC